MSQSPSKPSPSTSPSKQPQSEEEKKFLKMYGGKQLPNPSSLLISHKLKDRKYFDSGDYALSKAAGNKGSGVTVGKEHPSPDKIPHSIPQNSQSQTTASTSPAKESALHESVLRTDDDEMK